MRLKFLLLCAMLLVVARWLRPVQRKAVEPMGWLLTSSTLTSNEQYMALVEGWRCLHKSDPYHAADFNVSGQVTAWHAERRPRWAFWRPKVRVIDGFELDSVATVGPSLPLGDDQRVEKGAKP